MRKGKKRLLGLVFCFLLAMSTLAYGAQTPSVSAQTAILTEASTGKILFEKDAEAKIYPASMTKVLTALVAVEYFEPDDVIVVGREINEVSLDSSKAGHVVGESITFRNLVRGLMIPSGNDSAEVVACAVARKAQNDDSLSVAECQTVFADLMNQKAEELGCTGSHFVNAHGYHDDDHYTTAADLAKIGAAAMQVDLIREIGAEKSYSGNSMESQNHDGLITNEYHWVSHNLLITSGEYAYPYATGLKTGFTDEAGDCVLATAQKDGVQLIAVICKAEDPARWTDAAALFEYGFENFSFVTLAAAEDVVSSVGLKGHKSADGDLLDLKVKEDVTLFLDNETAEAVQAKVTLTAEDYLYHSKDEAETDVRVKAPVEAETELGEVAFVDGDGNVLAQAPVYAARSVAKAGIGERIADGFMTLIGKLFTLQGLIGLVIVVVVIVLLVLILRLRSGRRYGRNRYHFRSSRGRRGRRF